MRDAFSQGSAGHDSLPSKKPSNKTKKKTKATTPTPPPLQKKKSNPSSTSKPRYQPPVKPKKPDVPTERPSRNRHRRPPKSPEPQQKQRGSRGEPKVLADQDSLVEQCLEKTKKILSPAKAGQALVHLRRGANSLNKGDYDRAIPELTAALKNNPCLFEAYYNRALSLIKKGNVDSAREDYTRSLKLFPTVGAYNNRGAIYSKEKNFVAAILDYSAAISLNSEWPALSHANRGAAYYFLGYEEMSFGDTGRAMKYFNDAIDDLDKAIRDLNKAIEQKIELELSPANPYLIRGHAHYQIGNYDAAISDCEKAIQLDPFIPKVQECIDSSKSEKKVFEDRVKIELKNAYNYYERGNTYLAAKKFDKAIPDYEQAIVYYSEAIKREPNASKSGLKFAYLNCGKAHYSKNEYDAAITAFNKIIGPDPDINAFDEGYVDAYYQRGLAYAAGNNFDKAISDYTEAIKRASDKSSFRSNATYKRGIAYLAKGELAAAENSMQEYLEKRSGSNVIYAYLQLAAIYDQMNLKETDLEKKADFKKKARDMRVRANDNSVTQPKEEKPSNL